MSAAEKEIIRRYMRLYPLTTLQWWIEENREEIDFKEMVMKTFKDFEKNHKGESK